MRGVRGRTRNEASGFDVAYRDWTASGPAVDCRSLALAPCEIIDAIRRESVVSTKGRDPVDSTNRRDPVGSAATARTVQSHEVAVACDRPGPVHEHVGLVGATTSLSLRAALASVARSRGVNPEPTSELEAARQKLAAVEIPDADVAAARERVASARAAADAVHADVAAARGAVQARADLDADADAARDRLEAAVAAASERETERIAAEQALDRVRERAREARDARARRLQLADRVGRLERDVRSKRVQAVWDEFANAVDVVEAASDRSKDGTESAGPIIGATPGTYDGGDVTAASAVVRIAELSAPVVVAAGRFEDPDRAHELLQCPVVLATPTRTGPGGA